MRVCLVSREVAPLYGAGIGTYVWSMARAWADAGHEVHVLTAAHEGLASLSASLQPRVTLHAVDASSPELDVLTEPFQRYAMGVWRALERLHDAHRFGYIEFPDYGAEGYYALSARRTMGALPGAVLGLRLHTPTRDCRELNRESWLDQSLALLEHSEQACLGWADVVISPSRALVDRLVSRLGTSAPPGLLSAAVVPYPLGAHVLEELGASERAEQSEEPVVLYTGRLEHRKGVTVLVEAALRLLPSGRRVRFRLIGGDTATGPLGRSMRAHLQRLIGRRWRSHIQLEPPRPRHRLGAAIRGATVCCFPSLWENFPNACLEAMALGSAVVASGSGGLREIVEDGRSGMLVRPGCAAELADALARVLDDAALRARLQASAAARVAQLCDPARVVAQMHDTIEAARSDASARGRAVTAESPSVSVVVTFFNLARYLPETLDSVVAQTRPPDEILLIDDGSTERSSRALVRQIERGRGRWPGVRVIRQANAGLSAARNRGLVEARSDYVVFLDADDLLAPRYLERVLAVARREPQLAMITTLVAYFHEDITNRRGGWAPIGLERDLLTVTNCASPCTALLRREAVLEAGGYDPWLSAFEDWDLYCTLAERGESSAVVPEVLFFYRYRVDSMARTEGDPRRDRLRAYLLKKHPRLAAQPDRALRLHLAQVNRSDPRAEAWRICEENLRYRMADRINIALRRTPLHGPLKELTSRVLRARGGR